MKKKLGILFLLSFICIYSKGENDLNRLKEVDVFRLQNRQGIVYEVNNKNSFTGVAIEKDNNNNIISRVSYTDGKVDKKIIEIPSNQISLRDEIFYYKGELFTGKIIDIYRNGQIQAKMEIKNGEPNGKIITYYENGQLQAESIPEKNSNRMNKIYYENGQLKIYASINKQGELIADFEHYSFDGNPLILGNFDNALFKGVFWRYEDNRSKKITVRDVVIDTGYVSMKEENLSNYRDNSLPRFFNNNIVSIESYEEDKLIEVIKYENGKEKEKRVANQTFDKIIKLDNDLYAIKIFGNNDKYDLSIDEYVFFLIDNKGNRITNSYYKGFSNFRFKNGKALVNDLEKGWGFLDKDGNFTPHENLNFYNIVNHETLSLEQSYYSETPDKFFRKDIELLNNDEKYGAIHMSGEVILKPIYDKVNIYDSYIAYNQNGMWGLVDFQGNTILKPEYKNLGVWDDLNYIKYETKENLWGIIDFQGNTILKPEYKNIWSESDYIKYETKENLWGLTDTKGNIILKPLYDSISISNFNKERFIVSQNNKEYLITNTGKFISEGYDEILNTADKNLFYIKIDEKIGFIDSKGKVVIPLDNMEPFVMDYYGLGDGLYRLFERAGINFFKQGEIVKLFDNKGNLKRNFGEEGPILARNDTELTFMTSDSGITKVESIFWGKSLDDFKITTIYLDKNGKILSLNEDVELAKNEFLKKIKGSLYEEKNISPNLVLSKEKYNFEFSNYSLKNKNGEIIYDTDIIEISDFNAGVAIMIDINKQYGLIDEDGKLVSIQIQ